MFEAFKQELIEENETIYGDEIRRKYGKDSVEAANSKMMQMNEEEYKHFQVLEKTLLEKLQSAVANHVSPDEAEGREIALLHRDWLCLTGLTYSAEIHRGISELYVSDPRFTAYYDRDVEGCAEFLNHAVKKWI